MLVGVFKIAEILLQNPVNIVDWQGDKKIDFFSRDSFRSFP